MSNFKSKIIRECVDPAVKTAETHVFEGTIKEAKKNATSFLVEYVNENNKTVTEKIDYKGYGETTSFKVGDRVYMQINKKDKFITGKISSDGDLANSSRIAYDVFSNNNNGFMPGVIF